MIEAFESLEALLNCSALPFLSPYEGDMIVRASLGAFLIGFVAIVATILAAALHWPWPWWAFAIIGILSLIAGVFMLRPEQKNDGTVFIEGSPGLVVAEDVFSSAEKFVRGDPHIAFLRRIIHMPSYRRGKR
jgi:MFS family permease